MHCIPLSSTTRSSCQNDPRTKWMPSLYLLLGCAVTFEEARSVLYFTLLGRGSSSSKNYCQFSQNPTSELIYEPVSGIEVYLGNNKTNN